MLVLLLLKRYSGRTGVEKFMKILMVLLLVRVFTLGSLLLVFILIVNLNVPLQTQLYGMTVLFAPSKLLELNSLILKSLMNSTPRLCTSRHVMLMVFLLLVPQMPISINLRLSRLKIMATISSSVLLVLSLLAKSSQFNGKRLKLTSLICQSNSLLGTLVILLLTLLSSDSPILISEKLSKTIK